MVDDQYTETEYEVDEPREVEERTYVNEADEGDWTDWLDEGTIVLLLVVGVALFLFS